MGNDDVWILGIDEAGLGPKLGPLIVAGALFRAKPSDVDADWWLAHPDRFRRIDGSVETSVEKSNLSTGVAIVDDSKRIFSRRDGERLVSKSLAELASDAEAPESILTWLGPIVEAVAKNESIDPCVDVVRLVDELADRFRENRGSTRLKEGRSKTIVRPVLERLFVRPMFVDEFNRLVDEIGNKSKVETSAIAELIAAVFSVVESLESKRAGVARPMTIFVDRLGGRKFYRSFIESAVADSFPFAPHESAERSEYRVDRAGRSIRILFEVGADGKRSSTATASMLAKLVRELSMDSFNRFWLERSPGLKPTAGYPVDADRFLKRIGSIVDSIAVDRRCLIRKR